MKRSTYVDALITLSFQLDKNKNNWLNRKKDRQETHRTKQTE